MMSEQRERTDPAIQWLAAWVAEGREALAAAPPGPTAQEILAADRARLDPLVEPVELPALRQPGERES